MIKLQKNKINKTHKENKFIQNNLRNKFNKTIIKQIIYNTKHFNYNTNNFQIKKTKKSIILVNKIYNKINKQRNIKMKIIKIIQIKMKNNTDNTKKNFKITNFKKKKKINNNNINNKIYKMKKFKMINNNNKYKIILFLNQ